MNKTLLINILITLGISLAALGLVFYILNKAFAQKGYKNRFFMNLFFGIFLTTIFIISFIVDYKGENIFKYYYRHLILVIVSFAYSLLIITNILKKIKYTNIRIIKPKNRISGNDYLYVLFKYKDGYLLKKRKELYQGYIYKMKTNFHDEAMEEVLKKFSLNIDNKQYKGKISNGDKIYYCYLVEVDQNITGLEEVNMYDLVNLKADDFNKQAILSIILKEDFNIAI